MVFPSPAINAKHATMLSPAQSMKSSKNDAISNEIFPDTMQMMQSKIQP